MKWSYDGNNIKSPDIQDVAWLTDRHLHVSTESGDGYIEIPLDALKELLASRGLCIAEKSAKE